MGFLSNLGKGLFGSGPSVKTKQMYSQEDFGKWMEAVLGQASPYLSKLLGDYFGATAGTMGGTFGGQQGAYASQGVASQIPQFASLAGQLTQGQRQNIVKPGSSGLLGAVAPALGFALGGPAGAALAGGLGNIFGGGGGIPGQAGPASYGAGIFRPDENYSLMTRT